MTDYVLDVSKWRSGDHGHNKLGEGDTVLLNCEGFMCCLGQFAKQSNIPDEMLMGRTSPVTLHNAQVRIHGIAPEKPYDSAFVGEGTTYFVNSVLATKLMDINDDGDTTYQVKIDQIRETLKEYGHTLKVINGEINE